jgi:hypothetical protein
MIGQQKLSNDRATVKGFGWVEVEKDEYSRRRKQTHSKINRQSRQI